MGERRLSFASRAQNYSGECPDCPWPFLTVCKKNLSFTSCVGRFPRTCCESGSTACLFQSSGSFCYQSPAPKQTDMALSSNSCKLQHRAGDFCLGRRPAEVRVVCTLYRPPSVTPPWKQPCHNFPTHLGEYPSDSALSYAKLEKTQNFLTNEQLAIWVF